MKAFDAKALAEEFANVLKYNPELLQDPSRFEDLKVVIEVRLLQAYQAGLDGEPQPGSNTAIAPPTRSIFSDMVNEINMQRVLRRNKWGISS